MFVDTLLSFNSATLLVVTRDTQGPLLVVTVLLYLARRGLGWAGWPARARARERAANLNTEEMLMMEGNASKQEEMK